MTPIDGRGPMAVTVTPAPQLTDTQKLGYAAAEHERAQHELTRTRQALIETVSEVEESSMRVKEIARFLSVSPPTVYTMLEQARK